MSFSISADSTADASSLKRSPFLVKTPRPTITDGPKDATVEVQRACHGSPDAITASDNCGEAVTISEGTEVRFDGACPSEYFLQRRWTVTDCGNESIGSKS